MRSRINGNGHILATTRHTNGDEGRLLLAPLIPISFYSSFASVEDDAVAVVGLGPIGEVLGLRRKAEEG